jgi:hypothetical protein
MAAAGDVFDRLDRLDRQPFRHWRQPVVKAVWSFWTKPFEAQHHRVWLSERHHLLSWVLSVETARKHYPGTVLVTDSAGARLLVDRLGLPFTEVSVALDSLARADPAWWVLGKLAAYGLQREPFVHIDSDVMLWRPLPARLTSAAVLAQNPEAFAFGNATWYRPTLMDEALRGTGGWIPAEWAWAVERRADTAVCCGILGGHAVAFIGYYAGLAMRLVQDEGNRGAWARMGSILSDNILVEQYLLAACLGYHAQRPGSPFGDVHAAYLFESVDAAFDEAKAAAVGYTHLIGPAKGNRRLMERLEARVRRDHPAAYERCLAATSSVSARPPPPPDSAPKPPVGTSITCY